MTERIPIPIAFNDLLNSSIIDKIKISQCSLENNPEQKTMTLKWGDAQIILRMNSDITTQKADFIVNAANEAMLGGGGVDGAISKAGGEELLLFRRLVPQIKQGIRCPVGEARLTDAGCLPALFCIHAVGPRFNIQQHKECRAQLLHAYASSLKVAHDCIDSFKSGRFEMSNLEENLRCSGFELPDPAVIKNAEKLQRVHQEKLIEKLKNNEPISISFPTISTGIFGYPRPEGAILSLQAVLEYLQSNQGKLGVKVVQFIFLDQQPDLPYYQQALKDIDHASRFP